MVLGDHGPVGQLAVLLVAQEPKPEQGGDKFSNVITQNSNLSKNNNYYFQLNQFLSIFFSANLKPLVDHFLNIYEMQRKEFEYFLKIRLFIYT